MHKPKVLFLDDEVDLVEMLGDCCADIADVRIFSKPEEAIASALSDPPDIAFLDYRLPATTGIEVGGRFPQSVTLYLLTGELDVRVPPNFKQVLVKPVRMAKLIEIIRG